MADASPDIFFIIGLRRAGIENWVKYAISARAYMSLCLSLCASNNQALQIALLFAVHKLLRFLGSRVKEGGPVQVFVHTRVNGFTCPTNCSRSASRILDKQIVHIHKFEDKLALSSAEEKNILIILFVREGATTSCKNTWDTVPYFGLNVLATSLCLWSPSSSHQSCQQFKTMLTTKWNNFEWWEGEAEYYVSRTCY